MKGPIKNQIASWMAAHTRLKNEFTEEEKYHNLMTWLIYLFIFCLFIYFYFLFIYFVFCFVCSLLTHMYTAVYL